MSRSSRLVAIAALSAAALASAQSVAIAACAFELPTKTKVGPDGLILLQMTPAGDFTPSDGREMDVPAWRITAATAQRVIDRFRARKLPPVIDYEHQTLHKETNGQPAPAAGWIRDLRWQEGQGLFAVAELTERAREYVGKGEYRYFSPVFAYHPTTGEVDEVLMGALTNFPAVHGMDPLSLQAAATAALRLPNPQEKPVNPLLKAVLAALGMPESTSEANAVAALTAFGPLTDVSLARSQATAARQALQLGAEASGEAVIAACTSLRTTAKPDLALFVPIAVANQLRDQIAALTAQVSQGGVDDLVKEALADGRLLPQMETWARDLGNQNVASLTAYLGTVKPIAALTGTQTKGKAPEPKTGEHGLTEDELAVAKATGLTPEQYAKAKA